MGGYAISVNRFLSLILSLSSLANVYPASPLLSFRYASGPTLSSALSHLACPLRSALTSVRLVAGDGQQS